MNAGTGKLPCINLPAMENLGELEKTVVGLMHIELLTKFTLGLFQRGCASATLVITDDVLTHLTCSWELIWKICRTATRNFDMRLVIGMAFVSIHIDVPRERNTIKANLRKMTSGLFEKWLNLELLKTLSHVSLG